MVRKSSLVPNCVVSRCLAPARWILVKFDADVLYVRAKRRRVFDHASSIACRISQRTRHDFWWVCLVGLLSRRSACAQSSDCAAGSSLYEVRIVKVVRLHKFSASIVHAVALFRTTYSQCASNEPTVFAIHSVPSSVKRSRTRIESGPGVTANQRHRSMHSMVFYIV